MKKNQLNKKYILFFIAFLSLGCHKNKPYETYSDDLGSVMKKYNIVKISRDSCNFFEWKNKLRTSQFGYDSNDKYDSLNYYIIDNQGTFISIYEYNKIRKNYLERKYLYFKPFDLIANNKENINYLHKLYVNEIDSYFFSCTELNRFSLDSIFVFKANFYDKSKRINIVFSGKIRLKNALEVEKYSAMLNDRSFLVAFFPNQIVDRRKLLKILPQ